MKRLYLIPMLAALLSMVACSRDSATTRKYRLSLFPHKGASLNHSLSFGEDDIYFQSSTLEFSDTCSSECTVQVLLNGMLLTKKTGTSWSYTIAPELFSRDIDSLSFLIARRGTSARYGFPYERYDTMMLKWDNRIHGSGSLWSTDIASLGCIFLVNCLSDTVEGGGKGIRMMTDPVVLTNDVYPALGDLLFSPQDGDQMQLVVTWPDTVTFDAVDVLYDDHLLDHVTHSGWNRRYYLDDLYRDGVLRLRVKRNGEPRYYTLPRLAYHTKQVSHAGSMKIN